MNELFDRIGNDPQVIEIHTTPARLLITIAHLQLALRHPSRQGPGGSAPICREMTENLINVLAHFYPESRAVMMQGFDPDCDVPLLPFTRDIEQAIIGDILAIHVFAAEFLAAQLGQLGRTTEAEDWLTLAYSEGWRKHQTCTAAELETALERAKEAAGLTQQTTDDEEGSRLPWMNQDDPNRPGVGDQF